MQPEESPVATESELVKSTPIQKPKKQKKVRQKKEKKPKKQKSIPVEKPIPEPVTNNVPNSESEFAAGYAPAEQPLETDWTTEESSHSGWWDDSESKIPGSSGFDPTEEPAPQPEENESYTARFKKVVVQESTYTEPEQPEKTEKTQERKNATGEGTEACSARTKIYSQSGSGNSGQHQFVAERRLFPDSIVGSIDHNRCISCHRRIKLYAPVSGIVTADDGTGILFPASDFRAVDFVYYISNGHQWNAKAVPSRGRQRHDCSNAIDSVSADRSGNDFRSRAHAGTT